MAVGAVAVGAIAFVSPSKRWLVSLCVGLGALAANLPADRPWVTLLGFAVANALVPYLWVVGMTRGHHRRPQLLSAEDFGRFVLATLTATAVAGLVSATGVAVGLATAR